MCSYIYSFLYKYDVYEKVSKLCSACTFNIKDKLKEAHKKYFNYNIILYMYTQREIVKIVWLCVMCDDNL